MQSRKSQQLLKEEPLLNPSIDQVKGQPSTTTRIVVKYDVGFGNSLYIRGKGANLSWDRGIVMQNIHADEWVWETEAPFSSAEFKILINDTQYEIGDNHPVKRGASIEISPQF